MFLGCSVRSSPWVGFRVPQIRWWSRTGRSGRWSRRSPRWWPSAPAFPTWLLATRCRSTSPSCSTRSATCWRRARWCTSVWRNSALAFVAVLRLLFFLFFFPGGRGRSRRARLAGGRLRHKKKKKSQMTPRSRLLPAVSGTVTRIHESNAFLLRWWC